VLYIFIVVKRVHFLEVLVEGGLVSPLESLFVVIPAHEADVTLLLEVYGSDVVLDVDGATQWTTLAEGTVEAAFDLRAAQPLVA
jgi:hypothetical protein